MKKNVKATDHRVDKSVRLAGGYGLHVAKQDAEALLRRSVMACLLWEDLFYQDGESVVEQIKSLVPQVDADAVARIAIDARTKQKLRHVPLLLAREMARCKPHALQVSTLLPQIILRPDELTEFLALYWEAGKCSLSAQVKDGLAAAFERFDAYSFAKYRGADKAIKLRDVLFLCHPKPAQGREELYKQIADDTLPTPDTWEVVLSAGADKKATWERLIAERKIGVIAFLRNLRSMEEAGVDWKVMKQGFETVSPRWLLPLNCLAAAKAAPKWEREIEALMLRTLANAPKLPGYTVLVVDVSGSMNEGISGKSVFTRREVASSLAMLAVETCEHVALYATAGNDHTRRHSTQLVSSPFRGFALAGQIDQFAQELGGGGIFTRQCLEHIRGQERNEVDRIIVFSDSQDCDLPGSKIPAPFGKHNYICDVSAHDHGVNYKGVWTAEISGWSAHFLEYIAASEGLEVQEEGENDNVGA